MSNEKLNAINAVVLPTVKAGTVIDPMGKVCYAVYSPACAITATALTDEVIQSVCNDTTLTVKGIRGLTDRLYDAVAAYIIIDQRNRRLSDDKAETGEMLDAAEKVVSDLAKAWFKSAGSRDPRNKKDPNAKRRPLFGLNHGDITATLYHAVGGIQQAAPGDKDAQHKAFFERILVTTGAMMDGKSFADVIGDVDEKAVKAAKAAANKAAREKAAATRKANEVAAEKARIEEQKKAEELQAQTLQMESMKAEIAALKIRNDELNDIVNNGPTNEKKDGKTNKKSEKKPVVVNLAETLEAIELSSATADQKKAIIASLTTELKNAGIIIA